MRVVAGKARGRKLLSVPGDSTRPILDRVKTALFDTIRPEVEGASLLDMFAGTGSVGIEALSQGASFCVFTETSRKAIDIIKKNLDITELKTLAEVRHSDGFTYIRNTSKQFDIIYVAPPQYKGIWVDAILRIAERPQLLREGGLVIAQIDPSEYEELVLVEFKEERQKRYGGTMLVFYRRRD